MRRPLLQIALLASAHFALTILFLYLSLASAFRQFSGADVSHAWDKLLDGLSILFGSPLLTLASVAEVDLLHGATLYSVTALNSVLWALALWRLGRWKQNRIRTASKNGSGVLPEP